MRGGVLQPVGRLGRRGRDDELRLVGLGLDGVGARRGGHIDQAARRFTVAVMVDASLRDDETGVAWTNRTTCDLDLVHGIPGTLVRGVRSSWTKSNERRCFISLAIAYVKINAIWRSRI